MQWICLPAIMPDLKICVIIPCTTVKKEEIMKKFVVEKAGGRLEVSNSEVSYWWSGGWFGFGVVSLICMLMYCSVPEGADPADS